MSLEWKVEKTTTPWRRNKKGGFSAAKMKRAPGKVKAVELRGLEEIEVFAAPRPNKNKKKQGTITTWANHLRRLLSDLFTKKPRRSEIAEKLLLVERLIAKHSGPKALSGPAKGHSETETLKWVWDLAIKMQAEIQRRNVGRTYDGNMAMASQLGLVLVAWYAHVHHAKTLDPDRPLAARKAAAQQRTRFLAELAAVLADDSVMGEVWGNGQQWNFPYGKGAKGGKFL